jgi:hypothetical protein
MRSGKVKLVLGDDNVILDVSPATDVDFHQELVAVVPETYQCFNMGSVHRRLVTSMDVSSLAERDGSDATALGSGLRVKAKATPVRSARGEGGVGGDPAQASTAKAKSKKGTVKSKEKHKAEEVVMVDESDEEAAGEVKRAKVEEAAGGKEEMKERVEEVKEEKAATKTKRKKIVPMEDEDEAVEGSD